MAHGKKYTEAAKLVEPGKAYEPVEASQLVKATNSVKFDASIEVHLRLGVDPRHADQMVRGTVVLPSGTGKVTRVAVFAQGEKAQEALRAGADEVGSEDLVKKIDAGWLEFDVALATPDMMGQVGKLGRVLGPRGLMPNPKTGTVTTDVGKTVGEFKGGKVEYRTDRFGNVHVPIGKVSFPVESLVKNYGAVHDEIMKAKPASSKGKYLRSITTSSTMGPGVKIDTEKKAEL
jgi:large subunit ribosomal protein L1